MIAEAIRIRSMRAADVPAVCKMIKAMASGFGDKAKVSERDLHAKCFGNKKLSSIWLAVAGQKPVGFAITRDWMNFYLGIKFRHIDFIFVVIRNRQRGIGRRLIKAIANSALKAGCSSLSLDVGIENSQAARLYEYLGFEKRGHLSDHYRLYHTGLKNLIKSG